MNRTIYSIEQLDEMPIGSVVRRKFFYSDSHWTFKKTQPTLWKVMERDYSYDLTNNLLESFDLFPCYLIAL